MVLSENGSGLGGPRAPLSTDSDISLSPVPSGSTADKSGRSSSTARCCVLRLRAGDCGGASKGGDRTILDLLEVVTALDALDRDSVEAVRAIRAAEPGATGNLGVPPDGGAKFEVGTVSGRRAVEVGAGIRRAVVGVAGGPMAAVDEREGARGWPTGALAVTPLDV